LLSSEFIEVEVEVEVEVELELEFEVVIVRLFLPAASSEMSNFGIES
jgi:hypothetical protein